MGVTHGFYDCGARPCCAVNARNTVVGVHSGETFGRLYWRVGAIEDTCLAWQDLPWGYHHFAVGYNPDVALNEDDVLVAVHDSNADAGGDLHVWSGTVRANRIDFAVTGRRFGHQHGSSSDPTVAVNRAGQVIELHKSEAALYWCGGRLRGTSLTWRPEVTVLAHHGNNPSVAMNNRGIAVAVYDSRYRLYYTIGQVAADTTIAWTEPREYASGVQPSAALTDSGTIYAVHASPVPNAPGGKLLRRVGHIEGDRIAWRDGAHPGEKSDCYATGAAPNVASNGRAVIKLHSSSNGFPATLSASTAAVVDWVASSGDAMAPRRASTGLAARALINASGKGLIRQGDAR